MQFTQSPDFVTHGGTGNRMHQDTGAVDTVWSANDANMVIWNLMKLLTDGGISAAAFDPNNPATYNRVSLAVQALAAGAAETQGTFTPALTFGGAAVGMTYADQLGLYARRGNRVNFQAFIRLTAKGSSTGSAVVDLGALPAAAGNFACQGSVEAMVALTGHVSGMIIGNTNDVQVRMFDGSTTEAGIATHANFSNTTHLYLTGWYLAQ